jgi:hypothetical protein
MRNPVRRGLVETTFPTLMLRPGLETRETRGTRPLQVFVIQNSSVSGLEREYNSTKFCSRQSRPTRSGARIKTYVATFNPEEAVP